MAGPSLLLVPVLLASLPALAPATRSIPVPGEGAFNSCREWPVGSSLRIDLPPDTEIERVIAWFSRRSCTPFIIPSTVPLKGRRVTIVAPLAISRAEGFRLFYAALESVQLAVEPNGRFLRIVDAGRARMAHLPYARAEDPLPADKRFVTKLIRVQNLDALALANGVLARLKGQFGDVLAYHGSLIVTDTADNIRRMTEIIRDLDLPMPAEAIWLVSVHHMTARAMAGRLADIFPIEHPLPGQTGALPTSRPRGSTGLKDVPRPGDLEAEMAIDRIVPDDRSNRLVVVARPRAYGWLLAVLHRLDQAPEHGEQSLLGDLVHVYHCQNARCEGLAATLAALAGIPAAPTTGAPRIASTPNRGASAGRPELVAGPLRVAFDAPTNSVVVFASWRDFQALRPIIEKLDAPPKQVYVEAQILEVLLDRSRDVGVAYHRAAPSPLGSEGLLMGGFEASKTLAPVNLLSSLGGLTAALFGPATPAQNVQLFGTSVQLPSFGVFLQLLETDDDVNLLSSPSLLITNNEEGEITVGENLPFPGQLVGGFSPNVGGALGFPSIGVQRQDVALKMKIRPTVNQNELIRLDVEEEIADVIAQNYNGLGPATSKRSAKTSVAARDQQTVVIGGLMSDRATQSDEKIPILGDIPVIGALFRNRTTTLKKSNIVIALTPHLISNAGDLHRLAERKLAERRDFLDRYGALSDAHEADSLIDPGRKHGMVEEINRAARDLELEEAELQAVRAREPRETAVRLTPELPRSSRVSGS